MCGLYVVGLVQGPGYVVKQVSTALVSPHLCEAANVFCPRTAGKNCRKVVSALTNWSVFDLLSEGP